MNWTKIICATALFSLIQSGCSDLGNCDCQPDEAVARYNDSIIESGLLRFDSVMSARGEAPIHYKHQFAIRFWYYSAWGWQKVYRIEPQADSFQLVAKTTIHVDQGDSLVDHLIKPLSLAQVAEIQNMVNESCFWNMFSTEQRHCLDGAGWVLEVNDPNVSACDHKEFHIVSYSSCEGPDSANIFYLGKKIMELDRLTAPNGRDL